MANPKRREPLAVTEEASLLPVDVTGKFHTVIKESHLLYSAIEIDVYKGLVTDVRVLSRAPDMAQSAVGITSREIWVALRNHEREKVIPGVK